MKKYLLILALFFVASPAYAANTEGYAWGESLGWFDFSNVTVEDDSLSGYAYNDNSGWLVLDEISNDEGNLSGYAWSESVGYFDFGSVTISDNSFSGYAYNDNTGWLSFEDGTNVTTDWEYRRTTSSGSTRRRVKTSAPPPIPTSALTPENIPKDNSVRDLKLGDNDRDVKSLQLILNLIGYTVANSGPGSVGNETEYFGSLTQQALIRFQQENEVSPAVGYYGQLTRAALFEVLISKLLTNN
jgi:hypothetical protein